MIQRKNDYCQRHISLYMTKNTYSHGLNGLNKLNSRRKTLNNSWPNICNMTWKNENWFGTEEQGNEDEVGDNNPRWKTPKAELGRHKKATQLQEQEHTFHNFVFNSELQSYTLKGSVIKQNALSKTHSWSPLIISFVFFSFFKLFRAALFLFPFSLTTVLTLVNVTSIWCPSLPVKRDSFLSSSTLENILLSFLNLSSFHCWLLSLVARISFSVWNRLASACRSLASSSFSEAILASSFSWSSRCFASRIKKSKVARLSLLSFSEFCSANSANCSANFRSLSSCLRILSSRSKKIFSASASRSLESSSLSEVVLASLFYSILLIHIMWTDMLYCIIELGWGRWAKVMFNRHQSNRFPRHKVQLQQTLKSFENFMDSSKPCTSKSWVSFSGEMFFLLQISWKDQLYNFQPALQTLTKVAKCQHR